jgi:Zn-finger nucleic acid-binding protein
MRQYERSGITVDQCGDCRGIFLDRGELDRLMDAENAWSGSAPAPAPSPAAAPAPAPAPSGHYGPPEYYAPKGYGKPPKKRSSFLSELFD